MQALFNLFACLYITLCHISEYNRAIAGEYGAGSRGVCMVHGPINNSQYSTQVLQQYIACIHTFVNSIIH